MHNVLHVVSYSYPPANVPAAHRPDQMTRYLKRSGIAFRAYTREGVIDSSRKKGSKVAQTGGAKKSVSHASKGRLMSLAAKLGLLLEVDKATLWGITTFPRLWWDLVRFRFRTGRRATVWTTSPLVTNIYLATFAGIFSFSDVHLDLRDAIRGINGSRMPLFTRLAVNYAKTSTVVTPSLRQFILRRAPKLNPQIVYNGISDDALLSAKKLALDKRHRITLAYVGAVYGGDRPYVQAMEWLALAASELSKPWTGLSLTFVGREDVSDLPLRYVCDAFQINAGGEVGKQEALNISADSNINIVLVGKSEEHRCGIPLKIYDLLGVGRPILYIGPADSDAVRFLEEFAAGDFFMIDTEADHPASIETLAEWLCDAASKETSAKCEPSSSSQVRKILQLIGMESY